ncbi:MAG: rhomboid family intramembrane serine protease [Bacteroidetes bacterium]|nr:rhomboid family intramembrane serine protease [Bacteroidota bacterium]MBU1580177.1 rhomboid family intramembrane serine protease [Bacteroidota bacterium]MBU2556517.1 rhomboid family intramembrane serine protease [Bacteroidota bacterium]
MNPSQTNQFFDNFRHFFSRPAVLPRLIMVNTAVFLLVYIVNLFFWLFQLDSSQDLFSPLTRFLAIPASLSQLVVKPWTVLTYMFLHEGFFHLFFNMLVLYFGGQIFLQYLSQRKLLSTYLLGGLTGAAFYVLAYNLFPVFHQVSERSLALGASASVLAVLIAAATYVPHYTVNLILIGPVKLKYLAIVFVVLDFFSIQGNNPGGHIAHLGGALWGFLYIWLYRNGKDVYSVFNQFYRKPMQVKPGYQKANRPLTDDEFNRIKNEEQKLIDHILDKIAKDGYKSLTKKEKEFLFKSGKNN